MFQISSMNMNHKEEVLTMVKKFYQSDAVDHPVENEILERTFAAAVKEGTRLHGVVLYENEAIVGFAYYTLCYACEVGGDMLIVEEVFMKEECRGRGYGKKFFVWLFQEYSEVKRFRLEVTEVNENAVRLYQNLGFSFLDYGQMVCDR